MPDIVVSKKWTAVVILVILLVLTFLLLKPFFSSILFGIVIAYILQWPYRQLNRIIKNKGVLSMIICLVFVALLGAGIYFMAQMTIKEAFSFYMNMGQIDILKLTTKIVEIVFPNSPNISSQISSAIQTGVTNLINSYIQTVKNIIMDLPKLIAELFITFLVAFYILKDQETLVGYIKEILPFEPEVSDKFIKRSKDISFATIYGQIVVGIIQGIVAGIGFYLFHAQSPLFMTLLAIFFGMLPMLGAWVIWIPVALSMFILGYTTNGILLGIYGILVVSTIDNIVRPFVVGKKGKANPVIIFLGMIGGLTLIGPIGFIVGPIILEFTLIFIELYRKGNLKIKL
jgi:predicted PurR-regulated permease PerM